VCWVSNEVVKVGVRLRCLNSVLFCLILSKCLTVETQILQGQDMSLHISLESEPCNKKKMVCLRPLLKKHRN
jgi:hypothetical protein